MKVEVTQDILDYVDLIDRKFREAIERKLSRLSVEWGRWSREMNIELRKRIEQQPEFPQLVLYKYVFIYWVTRSKLLEVFFKYPAKLARMGLKKRLRKELSDIRKTILSGEMEDVSEDLEELLMRSVKI